MADHAIIFRAAMANPTFAQITSQPVAMFPSGAGEKPLVNEDELLHRYPGTIGGKTGFTDAAKKTFVAAADRGGRRLVIAMMYGLIKEGGPTYWDQAAGLLDHLEIGLHVGKIVLVALRALEQRIGAQIAAMQERDVT